MNKSILDVFSCKLKLPFEDVLKISAMTKDASLVCMSRYQQCICMPFPHLLSSLFVTLSIIDQFQKSEFKIANKRRAPLKPERKLQDRKDTFCQSPEAAFVASETGER